jgi:hypothetical protein
MRFHRFLLTALLVLGFAVPAHADLILFSNLGQPDNGTVSFNNTKVRYATDFLTDGTPRTITSVTAVMDSTDTIPHDVMFSIFTNAGGAPDALVRAFDTSPTVPGGASGTFTATSSGIDLQARTIYWLVGQLDDGLLRAPKTVNWHFTSSQATDGSPFSTVPGTPILGGNHGETTFTPSTPGNLLFVLSSPSVVPEPSSLSLVIIASIFGAFGWWRQRRVALDSPPDCGAAS